jgi:hypothetical protein
VGSTSTSASASGFGPESTSQPTQQPLLPPARSFSPSSLNVHTDDRRASTSSSSLYAPQLSSVGIAAYGLSEVDLIPNTPLTDGQGTRRKEEAAGSHPGVGHLAGEGGKKVTFRSPVPTPTTSVVMESIVDSDRGRAHGSADGSTTTNGEGAYPVSGPAHKGQEDDKDRHRRSPSPTKKAISSFFHKRPNPPSRTSTAQSIRAPTSRKASLPPAQPASNGDRKGIGASASTPGGSPTKSGMTMLSPTASESSLGGRSYFPAPNSWSEMAEDDLIANLGPKERTRQEVLYEIVSSEERYVTYLWYLHRVSINWSSTWMFHYTFTDIYSERPC